MLFLPLLPLLLQSPVLQSTELEVRPDGVFYVQHQRHGAQPLPSGQSPAAVTAPRWQVADGGLAWIGMRAAVGDSGASAMGGKELNNEGIALWPTGSATAIFDHSSLGSFALQVDIADRDSTAAGLESFDLGSSNFQSTVSVWDTTGNGTPDWTATLPITGNVFASMVAVNDNGSRVVAAVSNSSGLLHIRVWDRAGALLGSWDAIATANMRYGTIDDAGDRLYIGQYNGTALIYDLNTGAVLHSHAIGSSFDSHALSGDGKTFAYGTFSGLYVIRETSPGAWAQVAFRANPSSSYLARTALNTDGSRAAFGLQRYSPASDHMEVGMLEVSSGLDLNLQIFDAPGSAYQLNCSGVDISDDGTAMVAASWGDSLNVTPEVSMLDDRGNLLGSIDLPGSAFSVDMDPDGDVILVGSKAVHANTFGNGGSLTCIDATDQSLHVLGYPQLGGVLDVVSPAGANALTFSVATSLGNSMTPFGVSELDIATELLRVGPTVIPTGGLSLPLAIPTRASLAGMLVHMQGVRFGASNELTNKVSIRLLP